MSAVRFATLLLFALIATCFSATTPKLFVYESLGANGGPNAYLISDTNDCVIVDTGFNSTQALSIVRLANKNCKEQPKLIFLTHGHPDHYGGVIALRQQYPFTPVQVANEDIRRELLANVAFLNSSGLLSSQAAAFDWNATIGVLPNAKKITGLVAELTVDSDFPPAETLYYSVVYYSTTPFLITGDLVSVNTHLYLGQTVNYTQLVDWRARALSSLGRRYGTKDLVLYPGHGPKANFDSIADAQLYLQNFQALLLTCPNDINFFTPAQLSQEMVKIYPQYRNRGLLNFMVSNPAWPAAQRLYGCQIGLLPTPPSPDNSIGASVTPLLVLLLAVLLVSSLL